MPGTSTEGDVPEGQMILAYDHELICTEATHWAYRCISPGCPCEEDPPSIGDLRESPWWG